MLPVVIGELGNGGPKANDSMLAIRKAQKSAGSREEFKGTVAFAPTANFADQPINHQTSATATTGSAMLKATF